MIGLQYNFNSCPIIEIHPLIVIARSDVFKIWMLAMNLQNASFWSILTKTHSSMTRDNLKLAHWFKAWNKVVLSLLIATENWWFIHQNARDAYLKLLRTAYTLAKSGQPLTNFKTFFVVAVQIQKKMVWDLLMAQVVLTMHMNLFQK